MILRSTRHYPIILLEEVGWKKERSRGLDNGKGTCGILQTNKDVELSPNDGKGKGVHVHAMKACKGSRNIAPRTLNLGILGQQSGTDRIGGWVDSRPGLDILQNTCNPLPVPEFEHRIVQSSPLV
jgi:hypothetical protein